MASENAHAAKIENGVVTQVIVIPRQEDDRDDLVTGYCNSIGLPGRWVDTSYLGARRGKYAGINDLFDEEADEFTSPVSEPVAE